VRTAHAKQPFTQVELRLISLFLLEPSFPLLFWQRGTVAAILRALQILLQLPIALGHLLLAELIAILLLLQYKQQIWLPVALQIVRDLLLARLHPRIPKLSQLMRIAFACENGLDDGLPGWHSAPDHCAGASKSASCGSSAMAERNFATVRRCVASST